MKKFKTFAILGLAICTCFTACSKEQKPEKEKTVKETIEETTELSTEVINDKRVITFADASYGFHFMEVDEKANPMIYDLGAFEKDGHDMAYEDEAYEYRLGVDVSKYQGQVRWNKVARTGYEFAFLRLGYRGYTKGDIFLDECFNENIKGATSAGLDVGVYFFSQAINEEEAVEEAKYCIEHVKGYDLKMPIVYDPETINSSDSRTNDITKEQFTKNCIAFCEEVKAAGYEPMIYANLLWEANKLDMGALTDYPFWYADYVGLPQSPYDFKIWQYTDTGSVKGITGNADINIQIIKR